jgi:hypothetical protein
MGEEAHISWMHVRRRSATFGDGYSPKPSQTNCGVKASQRNQLKSLALPREVQQISKFSALEQGLGGNRPIDFQEISGTLPKPFGPASGDKIDLIIDPGDYPTTARELRDVLAASGHFFDRGVPVKIVPDDNGGPPMAPQLTPNKVVMAAHEFCRPVRQYRDKLSRATLPQCVARMYLDLHGEWNLPPLN